MSWIYLFIAGIFEIVWAVALKYADGFSNWFYSAVTIIGMVASVYFLAVAIENNSLRNCLRHLDRYRLYRSLYRRHPLVRRSLHSLQNRFCLAGLPSESRLKILSFLIQELHNSKRLFELYKGFLLKSGLNT